MRNNLLRRLCAALLLGFAAGACTGIPEGAEVVDDFDLQRYLGTWYEIARLDHRFERGLNNVTATYSLRDDGGVRVLNRGFNTADQEWEEAEGKAYLVDASNVGRLKVSFFGPFYGGYNILALDQADDGYSLVVGPDRDYLWILAREPSLAPEILAELVAIAANLGFPVDELIYVEHRGVNQ